MRLRLPALAALALGAVVLTGCASPYYQHRGPSYDSRPYDGGYADDVYYESDGYDEYDYYDDGYYSSDAYDYGGYRYAYRDAYREGYYDG